MRPGRRRTGPGVRRGLPYALMQGRTVLSIGNFDGVHAGHTALLERARRVAEAGEGPCRVVALAFDPHPTSVLRPERAPERLTTFARRRRLLLEAGADEVVRIEPTRELLATDAEDFAASLVERYAPVAFVEGEDFRFGRGRAGDVETLRRLGGRHGFGVETVEAAEVCLMDHHVVRASSTIIRWLVGEGRVLDAWRVLGRPHLLSGEVVAGDRRGRELGVPTANLRVEQLPPADGVYAGLARLEDGRSLAAAVSVGTKPQFHSGVERAVEAHLLDAPRAGECIEGLEEYGWRLELELLGWVRDQARFARVEDLVEQMHRDCLRVREEVETAGKRVADGAMA